jgi:inorganic phosphate transporter, PiT family
VTADLLATVAVIVFAMGFDYTNGFHDAANAIATSVSTRALRPRVALVVAAVGNLIGSFLGGHVAATVGSGVIRPPSGTQGLGIVFAGLTGAIVWNLVTWYFGIPSSSSHALFGGLVGATLFVPEGIVLWQGIVQKIVIPMVFSPVVGFVLGYLVMLALLWSFRKGHPGRLNRVFRVLQSVSAFAMSIGHGTQDAAKTIGVVGLALVTGGYLGAKAPIPVWVYLLSAAVLSLGTYAGGWRIIRTLGRRVIHLHPPEGFAAEATASTVLFVTSRMGLPISTTHTITCAIMGVGATKRLSAVRWAVAGNILLAWVLTFPASASVAALVHLVVGPLFR